jgi:hypothetical protein
MTILIFLWETLYKQIKKVDLKRYKMIDGKKICVKIYLKKLTDYEILNAIAYEMEINEERLKVNPNL